MSIRSFQITLLIMGFPVEGLGDLELFLCRTILTPLIGSKRMPLRPF